MLFKQPGNVAEIINYIPRLCQLIRHCARIDLPYVCDLIIAFKVAILLGIGTAAIVGFSGILNAFAFETYSFCHICIPPFFQSILCVHFSRSHITILDAFYEKTMKKIMRIFYDRCGRTMVACFAMSVVHCPRTSVA